jgi:hypothetical protein
MRQGLAAALTAASMCVSVLTLSAADKGVQLIGTGLVPGDLSDLSGLKGKSICQRDDETVCIDQATFGGFGSALTFTGHDDVFLGVPDRGPFDGRTDTPYWDRFHFLRLTIDTEKPFPNIRTKLLDTRFLRNKWSQHFVGDAYAFDTEHPRAALRFDPEGVALSGDGSFFVSDEYGPSILEFDRFGRLLRRVRVPAKFLLADPPLGHPTGDVDSDGNSWELYPQYNVTGRQANRGMEGLAITPNGRLLVGIMQNALIQDNGLNASTPPGRRGLNNRILTIDVKTGKTHEYVYVVDAINQGRGVNEMLAINDHEFLVLERDNRTSVPTPPNTAASPNLKRIYKIDLKDRGPTDVSDIESLPATGDELGSIVPVTKTLFLDLLDPDYKVNASQTIKDVIAEKIEGLAWGPDLSDGRHVLYVISDNDLYPGLPTQIYAFAIDAKESGTHYKPQRQQGPMFPPDLVKKILKGK